MQHSEGLLSVPYKVTHWHNYRHHETTEFVVDVAVKAHGYSLTQLKDNVTT